MSATLRRSSSTPSFSPLQHPHRSRLRRLLRASRRCLPSHSTPNSYPSPLPPTPTPSLNPSESNAHVDDPLVHHATKLHQLYARRNPPLCFLQLDMYGISQMRNLTRQQILTDIRTNANSSETANDHRPQFLARTPANRYPAAMLDHPHSKRDRRSSRRTRAAARNFAASPVQFSSPNDKRRSANRLSIRDMRQMDPQFPANPAIWIREDAMVVSLESVRAIILHDKILIFDPENDVTQKPIWYIRKRITNNEDVFLPFEFRALEGILLHTCAVLERDFVGIEPALRQTLGILPTRITNEGLEMLRLLEQRLNHYYSRARKVQHALQSVLDDDEDMAEMYLSEKYKNPSLRRNPLDHDEAEMLLETYMQTVDDVTIKAELLNRAIDHTENLIEIHLDTMQNRLLLVDLFITAITTTLSFGTLVTSIFGMNMPLPRQIAALPSSQFYFYGCVFVTLTIMAIGLAFLMRWCRREGIYRGRPPLRKKWRMRKQNSAIIQVSEAVRQQAEEVLAKTNKNTLRQQFTWEREAADLTVRNGRLV